MLSEITGEYNNQKGKRSFALILSEDAIFYTVLNVLQFGKILVRSTIL